MPSREVTWLRQLVTVCPSHKKRKLESLSNGVDFKDEADFAEKIAEIAIEAYFPKESDKLVEDTIVEEGTGELDEKKEPLLRCPTCNSTLKQSLN